MFTLLGILFGGIAIAGVAAGGDFNPFEDVEDRIDDIVEDDARNEQATEIAERMADLFDENKDLREDRLDALGELMRDRNALGASFMETAEWYDDEGSRRTSQILDLRFQLREILTQQEWERAFQPHQDEPEEEEEDSEDDSAEEGEGEEAASPDEGGKS